jgi:hypothetical protein
MSGSWACPPRRANSAGAGAAKTYYWVDPREELAAVLMTQFMIGFDLPENDFRALVYQAIDD